MAGRLLKAGKVWFEARIAQQPLPRGERIYALVGKDKESLESLTLQDLARSTAPRLRADHRLMRRVSAPSMASAEVIASRHVKVQGNQATLSLSIPIAHLAPAPSFVCLRQFDANGQAKTLFQAALNGVDHGVFLLLVEHKQEEVTLRTNLEVNRGHFEFNRNRRRLPTGPIPSRPPILSTNRGVVVGNGLCAAWTLGRQCGGIRLEPKGVVAGQPLGKVVGQHGRHSQTVAEVATRDSDQLQLLKGVGPQLVQRMARARRPVKTLADLAFLPQAGYRDLGIRAKAAKQLSRDALLMLYVTGVSKEGALFARVIREALDWSSRSQLAELVQKRSQSTFDRAVRRAASQLRNRGENVPRLSQNHVSLWWTKISELLP